MDSSLKQARKQRVLGSTVSLPTPDGLLPWMVDVHILNRSFYRTFVLKLFSVVQCTCLKKFLANMN